MEDQPLKRLDYIVGSECTTLVQLLRWRASLQSDQKAYTFLSKGEEELSLTYAELDRQSRAIGAMLQRQGAIGERVLLLYPAGLEYIAVSMLVLSLSRPTRPIQTALSSALSPSSQMHRRSLS